MRHAGPIGFAPKTRIVCRPQSHSACDTVEAATNALQRKIAVDLQTTTSAVALHPGNLTAGGVVQTDQIHGSLPHILHARLTAIATPHSAGHVAKEFAVAEHQHLWGATHGLHRSVADLITRALVNHVHERGATAFVAALEERQVTAIAIGRDPRTAANLLDGVRKFVLIQLISTQDSKTWHVKTESAPSVTILSVTKSTHRDLGSAKPNLILVP